MYHVSCAHLMASHLLSFRVLECLSARKETCFCSGVMICERVLRKFLSGATTSIFALYFISFTYCTLETPVSATCTLGIDKGMIPTTFQLYMCTYVQCELRTATLSSTREERGGETPWDEHTIHFIHYITSTDTRKLQNYITRWHIIIIIIISYPDPRMPR